MSDTKLDRRNILAVLGLGGAAGMSTEAVGRVFPIGSEGQSVGMAEYSPETQEKIARALEKLAYEVRSNMVVVHGFTVNSEFKPDNWMEHSVSLKVEIRG